MKKPVWQKLAWWALLAAPSLLALGWTAYPSLLVLEALASFTPPATSGTEDEWLDASHTLEIRRTVQKHFRDHDVYIPLEDIVTPSSEQVALSAAAGPENTTKPEDLSLLMQKACGRGKLYVWIPFKLNLPVIGEKVFEWCWKPRIKTS